MDFKRNFRATAGALASVAILIATLMPAPASAGYFELSLGGSFSQSQYTETSYNWTRRYGASVGYHLSDVSEIEVAFQDVFDRTVVDDGSFTDLHDQIYSVNWVQSLVGKSFPIQPYLKAGLGQLVRDLSGTFSNGKVMQIDSVTGIIGAGFRIYFTQKTALRGEATSYLSGGRLSSWKKNTSTQLGLSFYF